jgi:nardilysin
MPLSSSSKMTNAADGVSASFFNTEDFVRAKTDKNAYRLITLENGLEVLLVTCKSENAAFSGGSEDADDANSRGASTSPSENESLVSEEQESDDSSGKDDAEPDSRRGFGSCAVAMAVGVGSFHELAESEPHGIAHLLEHMLFMGSEKYPSENAYDDHLHKFGGFSNAYTEAECTVYCRFVTY